MFRKNSTNDVDNSNINKTTILPIGAMNDNDSKDAIEQSAPKFTRFLVGTYIDPVTNEWMIAQAPLDPVLKVTGNVTVERVAGDMEVMKERLVIKQGMLGIFEAGEFSQEKKMEIY
jgi:hypothetical protein